MTCATCHCALCDCTDAAWLHAQVVRVPTGTMRSAVPLRGASAAIRARYFHAGLASDLIAMVSAGKTWKISAVPAAELVTA